MHLLFYMSWDDFVVEDINMENYYMGVHIKLRDTPPRTM